MEKIKCSSKSMLARFLDWNYGFLPKSICSVFWATVTAILLLPFAGIFTLFFKAIPKTVLIDEDDLDISDIPIIARGIMAAILLGVFSLIAYSKAEEVTYPILIIVTAVLIVYIAIVIAMGIAKLGHLYKNREKDHYEEELDCVEESSWRILKAPLKSLKDKTCKPIEWK